jgi:DNA-binding MarR family transcriptional regulator
VKGAARMDNDTVIRLRRVVLRLGRQLNAASRQEGLTPTQASVLGITVGRGPLSLAELTELEGINPTMLSRVIGKLDSFGLIKRLRDPDDFRAARVEATSEGRLMHERISAQRSAIISECVAGLAATRARVREPGRGAAGDGAARPPAGPRGPGSRLTLFPVRGSLAHVACGHWPGQRAVRIPPANGLMAA